MASWYNKLKLKLPNTINSITGYIAYLKNKLRNQDGLSEAQSNKFTNDLFKA